VPGEVFEFVAEGYTTWRYELVDHDGGTSVTESFRHEPYSGWQKYVYGMLMRREASMVAGMGTTLARMKAILEA
jgi:hypothetical protein